MGVVFDGILMAIAGFLGTLFLYHKLPKLIKFLIIKLEVLIDIFLTIGILVAIPQFGRSTALATSGIFYGIFISVALYFAKRRRQSEKIISSIASANLVHSRRP